MIRNSIIITLCLFLFQGINTNAKAQPDRNSKELTTETDTSTTGFIDRFRWVNAQNNGIHEIHLSGGYSFHSTRGFWGKIPGADLMIWGLRYNRKLFHFNEKHLLEYVGELNFSVDYTLNSTKFDFKPGSFSGFGITPLGFQFNWQKKNIVQPFFKSSTGFMYFNNQIPDDRGTQFNFTLELGGGLEFVVAKHFSFTLGYKYHHMSNGQFGDINPGIDSNIFYSGITIF
jgi:hypothetical protein